MSTKHEVATDLIGTRGYPRHYQALGMQPPMREVPVTGPEDPGTPPELPPTQGDFERAIQAHVDAAARSRNYADGNSLASYVNSTVATWAAEATTFVAWRDAVWVYSYAELAKALNQLRPVPAVADFIEELPAISWPEQPAA